MASCSFEEDSLHFKPKTQVIEVMKHVLLFYFFLEMRKQWFQKHGQVPRNPGKAEELSFRKLRKNIRIRLKETGRRKSCRGQDHLGSSGSRIPGSSGRLPPWTWPIHSLQVFFLELLCFSFTVNWFPPPPTLYSPSFFTVAAGPLILPPLNRSVLLAPHGPISTSSLLLLHILYNLSLQTAPLSPRFSILTPKRY